MYKKLFNEQVINDIFIFDIECYEFTVVKFWVAVN